MAARELPCYSCRSIHCAASSGHPDCLSIFISEKNESKNEQNYRNRTPLHCAAMNGHSDCIRLLIEEGADDTIVDNDGCVPLHYAAKHSHTRSDCIEALLSSSLSSTKRGRVLDAIDKSSWTPLHYAVSMRNVRAISLLMEAGADPNIRDGFNGNTPLHDAIDRQHINTVEAFLITSNTSDSTKRRKIDVNMKNVDGNTPLHRAAKLGFKAGIFRLVEAGASKSEKNNDGLLPIDMTYRNKFKKLLYEDDIPHSKHCFY